MFPSARLMMRPTQRLLSTQSNSHTHGVFAKLRQMKNYAPQEVYPLFFICTFMLSFMIGTATHKLFTDKDLRRARQNRRVWDD